MRIAFSALIAVHALIHVMGFAKAFGLALARAAEDAHLASDGRALARGRRADPRGRRAALRRAPLVLAGRPGSASWPRRSPSSPRGVTRASARSRTSSCSRPWSSAPSPGARSACAPSTSGSSATGPRGWRAAPGHQNITEADLAALPPLVQRYLRFAGVVGTPKVQGFRARMTGRIRGSATAPWMPFVAEQHNFYDPPRRYFWMEATRGGLAASTACTPTARPTRACGSGSCRSSRRRPRWPGDDADRDGHRLQRHVHLRPGQAPRPGDPLARARRAQRGGDVHERPTHRPRRPRLRRLWRARRLLVRRSPGARRGRQDHASPALVHADPRLPGDGALPARHARRGPLRRAGAASTRTSNSR